MLQSTSYSGPRAWRAARGSDCSDSAFHRACIGGPGPGLDGPPWIPGVVSSSSLALFAPIISQWNACKLEDCESKAPRHTPDLFPFILARSPSVLAFDRVPSGFGAHLWWGRSGAGGGASLRNVRRRPTLSPPQILEKKQFADWPSHRSPVQRGTAVTRWNTNFRCLSQGFCSLFVEAPGYHGTPAFYFLNKSEVQGRSGPGTLRATGAANWSTTQLCPFFNLAAVRDPAAGYRLCEWYLRWSQQSRYVDGTWPSNGTLSFSQPPLRRPRLDVAAPSNWPMISHLAGRVRARVAALVYIVRGPVVGVSHTGGRDGRCLLLSSSDPPPYFPLACCFSWYPFPSDFEESRYRLGRFDRKALELTISLRFPSCS